MNVFFKNFLHGSAISVFIRTLDFTAVYTTFSITNQLTSVHPLHKITLKRIDLI